MKVRNLNNSSAKTRKLIKETFFKMLVEKKEIRKITISDLVVLAHISRATFYSHFDDIYGVVEEYENELTEKFFTNAKLLATDDYEKFFTAFFEFIKKNDENYKMICSSDVFLFSAKRLAELAADKLLDIINNDGNVKDKAFIELEVHIFVEGLLCEYIKHCRGLKAPTIDELNEYSLEYYKKFMKERCR